MNISLIQIIIIIFALFAWSRTIIRMRDKAISIGESVFWSLIWIAVLVVAIFPSIIIGLSQFVGIGRGVDLLMYFGVILLFYLIFRLYVEVDSQSRQLTALVRQIAMQNVKDNRQKIKSKKVKQ